MMNVEYRSCIYFIIQYSTFDIHLFNVEEVTKT